MTEHDARYLKINNGIREFIFESLTEREYRCINKSSYQDASYINFEDSVQVKLENYYVHIAVSVFPDPEKYSHNDQYLVNMIKVDRNNSSSISYNEKTINVPISEPNFGSLIDDICEYLVSVERPSIEFGFYS